jgi:hypothetical protein
MLVRWARYLAGAGPTTMALNSLEPLLPNAREAQSVVNKVVAFLAWVVVMFMIASTALSVSFGDVVIRKPVRPKLFGRIVFVVSYIWLCVPSELEFGRPNLISCSRILKSSQVLQTLKVWYESHVQFPVLQIILGENFVSEGL